MSARFTTMLALIAAMLMTVDAAFATESSIDSSTVTVKVTGYGASVSEARADAVRQAMQRTLSQLVVSDVEVNQDKVLRDYVMSTMNGFVDKVQEHSVRREGDEIVISSSITVSTKRMTNFLGLQSKAANVDGLSLFSELNRESEQREIVAEILARTFRGFPSETIETTVTSIKPAADNPDEFIIEFTAGFRKEWIRSLEDTLKALAVASYEFETPHDIHRYRDLINLMVPESGGDRWLSEFRSKAEENGINIQPLCIVRVSESKINCYVLPAGNYPKWFTPIEYVPYQNGLGYINAPTTENGASTSIGNCCEVYISSESLWTLQMKPPLAHLRYVKANNIMRISHVYADKKYQSIRVNRTSFNLPQTRKLLILPVVIIPYRNDAPLLDAIFPIPATKESIMKAARDAALQK